MTTPFSGDTELAYGTDRLWHEAACLLGYRLKGKDLGWYKEVRTSSDQLPQAVKDRRKNIVQQLAAELKRFDFPVFVLNEWGQAE